MKEYDNNLKGALWLKTSQAGNEYLTGTCLIDNVEYKVTAFKNEKQNERQPDYRLKFEPMEEDKTDEMLGNMKSKTKADPYQAMADKIAKEEDDFMDSLPF